MQAREELLSDLARLECMARDLVGVLSVGDVPGVDLAALAAVVRESVQMIEARVDEVAVVAG